MNRSQLTPAGYKKLEAELNELKNIKRPQAVDRLTKARSMGDLSENSEYTAAKENLTLIDERIKEMEEVLKHSQIASQPNNLSIVELGETVIVQSANGQSEFTIVGEYEADPTHNKLSISSPIGKALLGKHIGDIVEVNTPAGKISYTIIKIK